MTDRFVPALAERYTTYAVDWPGNGGSPAPPEPGATTAMGYAGILPEVLAGLGLPQAALIGNSVGGYAAARLAITHPEAVSALILVNSGGFTRHSPLARAVGTRRRRALESRRAPGGPLPLGFLGGVARTA